MPQGEEKVLVREILGEEQFRRQNNEALIDACIKGYTTHAEALINLGADIHFESETQVVWLRHGLRKEPYPPQSPGEIFYKWKATPLLAALVNKRPDTVSLLINCGEDPNKIWPSTFTLEADHSHAPKGKYHSIETLLHLAAKIPDNAAVIKVLLAKGANPRATAIYDDPCSGVINPSFNETYQQTFAKFYCMSCVLGCVICSPVVMSQFKSLRVVENATPFEVARHFNHVENTAMLHTAGSAPARQSMFDEKPKPREWTEPLTSMESPLLPRPSAPSSSDWV